MAPTTETEASLIDAMQKDTAAVKVALARIAKNANKLAEINRDAGRLIQAADAGIWYGQITQITGTLYASHNIASKALISGYANGADIVTNGPGR